MTWRRRPRAWSSELASVNQVPGTCGTRYRSSTWLRRHSATLAQATAPAWSVPTRWAWGAEDDHPVACADLGEPSDIRRPIGRRWQDALGCVLAGLSLE